MLLQVLLLLFDSVAVLLFSPRMRSLNGQQKPRLPSNAVREILQLAGCDIPSPRAADEYINAKVNEFLNEIVRNTLTFTSNCRRIEAVPDDVAHALRLFAEDGPSGPKFVFDYSNDGEDVWVNNEDVNEEEDMNVTDSMIDVDNSSYDEYIDEDKYQEDNLINIFHTTYPPVLIEELTDKQFRKEVLQPMFSGYSSMYMGFDIDEEDYADEAPKDVDYWNPQPRDAPVIISMLKRAMYAFIVALVQQT